MAKRMTKQVKAMIEATNENLRFRHVKDEGDEIFNTVQWLLLQAECYHGFNYFTVDGRLSGGDNNERFDHLEFYIW